MRAGTFLECQANSRAFKLFFLVSFVFYYIFIEQGKCRSMCVEVRGQFLGVGSLLSPCRFKLGFSGLAAGAFTVLCSASLPSETGFPSVAQAGSEIPT